MTHPTSFPNSSYAVYSPAVQHNLKYETLGDRACRYIRENKLAKLQALHNKYGLQRFNGGLIYKVNRDTNIEIVEFLLSTYEGQLGLRDQFDHTPAHLAASQGRLDLLRLYAQKGADFKAVNCYQESILVKWVIIRENYFGKAEYLAKLEEGIDFLLSQGIDINQPDDEKRSVLDRARSEKLYPEVEAALLKRGAISTKPPRKNYLAEAFNKV